MVLHFAMHPSPNCCRLIDNCTKAVKGPVGTVPYALAEAEGPALGLRTGRASSCYSASSQHFGHYRRRNDIGHAAERTSAPATGSLNDGFSKRFYRIVTRLKRNENVCFRV